MKKKLSKQMKQLLMADNVKIKLFQFRLKFVLQVLPLQNEMKKPTNFTRPAGVLNIGMSVVTILYITVGFLAYLKYGESIKGSVTLNLPEQDT